MVLIGIVHVDSAVLAGFQWDGYAPPTSRGKFYKLHVHKIMHKRLACCMHCLTIIPQSLMSIFRFSNHLAISTSTDLGNVIFPKTAAAY